MHHSRSTPNLCLLSKYCLLLLVSKDWPIDGDARSIWEPDHQEESFFFGSSWQISKQDLSFPETEFQLSLEGALAPLTPTSLCVPHGTCPSCRARKFPWILSSHLSVSTVSRASSWGCLANKDLHFNLFGFLYTTRRRETSELSRGGAGIFQCWLGKMGKPFSPSVNLH